MHKYRADVATVRLRFICLQLQNKDYSLGQHPDPILTKMKLRFLNGGVDPSLFVLLLMNMLLAAYGQRSACSSCYTNSSSKPPCRKQLPGKAQLLITTAITYPATKEKPTTLIPIPGSTTPDALTTRSLDETTTSLRHGTVPTRTYMPSSGGSTHDKQSIVVTPTHTVEPTSDLRSATSSDVLTTASTAAQHPTIELDRSTSTITEEQKYPSAISSASTPSETVGTRGTSDTATPSLMGATPETTWKPTVTAGGSMEYDMTSSVKGLSTAQSDGVEITAGTATVLGEKETTQMPDVTAKSETVITSSKTSFETTSVEMTPSTTPTVPSSTTTMNTESVTKEISSRKTETTGLTDATHEHMEITKQISPTTTGTMSSVETDSSSTATTSVQDKGTTMEKKLESSEAYPSSTATHGSSSASTTDDTTPAHTSTSAPDIALSSHAASVTSDGSPSSNVTSTTTEATVGIEVSSASQLEGRPTKGTETRLTSSFGAEHLTTGNIEETQTTELPEPTETSSPKRDATSAQQTQSEKLETRSSADSTKPTESAMEFEKASTMEAGPLSSSQISSTEVTTKETDETTEKPSPSKSSRTSQQTDHSSASTSARPLTSGSYQSTTDRTTAEMFSKSVESAMPKSTPAPKVSKKPITSKLPKQTTVANYVATTKSPVLLLETTQDRSLTTRVPDSVTFVNTFATAATTESIPGYCGQPCPDQFWDSGDMCYLLVPRPQSVSYIRAISYCQSLSDKTDMAWARDYVNATLNEQFTNMLNQAGITSLLVYYNEKGSKEFRANKKINATSLSEIDTKYYGILDFDDIINNQIINQKSDYVRNDVSAFCRTPRYCQKNRCAFSDFVDAGMAKMVGLPNGVEFLQEGDQVVLPCIQNDKAQTVRTRCSSYGTWVPHPSLLNCDPPAHPIEEDEVEFEGNPKLQTSCSACYKWGTDKCVRQENGLFQCVCKPGWTRFKCWKSPNMCANVTTECGAGKCRSLVDMYDCVCPVTFFGDKCQYNKTSMTLFGKNNTVAYVSWGTMGQITMTTTNLLLLIGKLCGKFTLIDDPEDPQETYCFLRKAALSAAGFVAVLWKNPQLLGVDSVSCRFFWMIINHLYTYALFMAANEAINFYTVMDGLSRNWWGNYEGKYTWYFSYRYRVYYAMFALVAFYGLISAVYWTNLVHPWTCLSSFVSPKDELWLLTTCMMLTLGFFGTAFGEAGCLVMKTRPHGLIKVKAYFEHLWPCEKGILTKVIRNKFYAPLMPMVLFLQWYYLVRSTDEPSFYFDMMTFVVSAVYTVLNVLQTLHCSTGFVRTQYVIFAMCYLPKWMSPEYEEESWRNRDEVLAKCRPRRYASEQQEKKDAMKAEREKERDEIRKKNQELLNKNPNLPQRLLYHVPEDGPEQCETVSLEMDMTLDCYIPDYKKKVFERRWTRMYLEYRMRAYTVKDSIARVLMEEMRRGLLKKHGAEHEMEIRLYNHWCHTVPDRDHINVRNPHQDRVFIMPEGPPDRLFLMKFDRLINRVVNAARQGLFMPVRPRQLPENPDVREFKQVLDFMKWQFPNKLDTLDFETTDANMHPQEQTFLKGADIVIEEQFEDWDAKLKEAMEIENEKFDKVYEDDVCFSQYIGTSFEEHAREIFNVRPKFCPDGERLANPRNRPIDNHFQDDLMPGFIGPAPRSRVNLGPYDEFVKKAAYYQGIVDGEWDAVRGNAAIQRRDRHMRTGRGEFEGNFDNNWRGKAKMYLWRLIAKDD